MVFGDLKHRNKKCPRESVEQITFVNRIRNDYPDTYGKILLHPKNEGLRESGQFSAIAKDRAMGHLTIGASDIIIPGRIAFVCEIKRQDSSLSKITDEQIEFLIIAQKLGAFACVALGCDAATEAFNEWMKLK